MNSQTTEDVLRTSDDLHEVVVDHFDSAINSNDLFIDTGYLVVDSGHAVIDSRYLIFDISHSIIDASYSIIGGTVTHTERSTPTPVNITFAGENTCQMSMRPQVSDELRRVHDLRRTRPIPSPRVPESV